MVQNVPPECVVHKRLAGSVTFVPFPCDTEVAALAAESAKAAAESGTECPAEAPRGRRGNAGLGISEHSVVPPFVNPIFGAAGAQDTALVDVFLAQLPFDMPLSVLQLLFDRVVLSVQMHRAVPHAKKSKPYDGCVFVKVDGPGAKAIVSRLHKQALFDATGLWLACGAAEQAALDEYCASLQGLSREERSQVLCRPIPFSAVTAEYARKSFDLTTRSYNV